MDVECEKDIAYLQRRFSAGYFFVKVVDETTLKIHIEDYLLEESLKGEFIRTVFNDTELSEQDKAVIIRYGLQALAGEENTLFMVGDVKQSIYRFRLANPKLFLARITDRSPGAGECIFLQENFRSRPEVLETTNTVFRDVMRREAADLD